MDEFSFLDDLQKKREQVQPVQKPVNSLGEPVRGEIDNAYANNNDILAQLVGRDNIVSPQQQSQPQQQEESGFWQGFGAGAGGVATGLARLGQIAFNTDGKTIDQAEQYLQDKTGRSREWTVSDMWNDPYGYLTQASGLRYGAGNLVGSMAAMTGLGAAVGAALPASVTAGTAGMLANVAGRVYKLTGGRIGMPLEAAKEFMQTPAGKALVAEYMGRIIESGSEGGSAGAEKLQETGDINEARKTAAIDSIINMGILTGSGALNAANVAGMIGNKEKGKLARYVTGELLEGAQQGFEEGSQQTASEYAQGKAELGNFLPWNWSDSAKDQAAETAIVSPIFGGARTAGGKLANSLLGKQQQETEDVEQEQQSEQAQVQQEQPEQQVPGSNDLVNKVRALKGQIPFYAEDGTNCMRTMGIALAGTPYEGQINVDQAIETATELGQLMDPETYTPRPGDLAVNEDGEHIVMVTENGGTIQNGASRNGVYESDASAAEMSSDGKVKYYIRTSDYSNGGSANNTLSQGTDAGELVYTDELNDFLSDTRDMNIFDSEEQEREQQEAIAKEQAELMGEEDEELQRLQETVEQYKRATQGQANNVARTRSRQAPSGYIAGLSDDELVKLATNMKGKNVSKSTAQAVRLELARRMDKFGKNTNEQKRQATQTADDLLFENQRELAKDKREATLEQRLAKARADVNRVTQNDFAIDRALDALQAENDAQMRANRRTDFATSPFMPSTYDTNPRGTAGFRNLAEAEREATGKVNTATLSPEELERTQDIHDRTRGKVKVRDMISRVREERAAKKQQALDYEWMMAEHEQNMKGYANAEEVRNNPAPNVQKAAQSRAMQDVTRRAMAGDHGAQRTFDRMGKAAKAFLMQREIDRLTNENDFQSQLASTPDRATEPFIPAAYERLRKEGRGGEYEALQERMREKKDKKQEKLELAEGYSTESGRSLLEADENEYIIRPDGSKRFGYISQKVADASNGELKSGEIRLKVGNGYEGLYHAKKHEQEIIDDGYESAEEFILDRLEGFDEIYKRVNKNGKVSYTIVKYKKGNDKHNSVVSVAIKLDADEQGNYYAVLTSLPKNDKKLQKGINKETLVYRSPAIDATTTPNGSAVSTQSQNEVGLGERVLPTSEETNVSNDSIAQSKTVDNENSIENVAKKGETNESKNEQPQVNQGGENTQNQNSKLEQTESDQGQASESTENQTGEVREAQIVNGKDIIGKAKFNAEKTQSRIEFYHYPKDTRVYDTEAGDIVFRVDNNNIKYPYNVSYTNYDDKGNIRGFVSSPNATQEEAERLIEQLSERKIPKDNSSNKTSVKEAGESTENQTKLSQLKDNIKKKDQPAQKEKDIAKPKTEDKQNNEEYKYYMNERGASPGAVPDGFTRIDDNDKGGKYGAIYYSKPLTKNEIAAYELTPDSNNAKQDTIQDFGNKIGGARKDKVYLTDPFKPKAEKKKAKTDNEKELPEWRKPFNVYKDDLMGGVEKPYQVRFKQRPGSKMPWAYRALVSNGYATEQEAETAIKAAVYMQNFTIGQSGSADNPNFTIEKRIGAANVRKYFPIKDGFKTREEAQKYAVQHIDEILATKTYYGEADLATPLIKSWQDARTGDAKDRLKGKNATAQMFADEFGFYGVQFGNWNNQQERQEVMNAAYEGLHDLAEALGLPPKIISLNGNLGLAFGARGQGLSGAKAHFEPMHLVINLTKMKGAGSLAHEWMHAVDQFLLIKGGIITLNRDAEGKLLDKNALSKASELGYNFGRAKLNKELSDSFKNLMNSMLYKDETFTKDKNLIDKRINHNKEALDQELNKLRKYVSEQRKYGSRKAPATAEQLKEFDELATRIAQSEEEPKYDFGVERYTTPDIEALGVLVKKITGRGFAKDNDTAATLVHRIRMGRVYAKEKQNALEQSEGVRQVPTDYKAANMTIDSGRATDYWTKPTEMLSRAFSAFVEDELKGKGYTSDFLSYGSDNRLYLFGKPFPEGKERERINENFKEFFKEVAKEVERNQKENGEIKFSIKPAEWGAKEEYPTGERTYGEVLEEIVQAFPNAKVETKNGLLVFSLPNGSKFQVSVKKNIILNAKQQKKALASHGVEEGQVQGYWRKLTTNGVERMLAVSKSAEKGTAFHEAMHAAIDLALTEKERNALTNYYNKLAGEQGRDVEEVIADAYRDWVLKRPNGQGTSFGKLWRKIKDFCTKIKALFDKGAEVQSIFQDVESGKVYERKIDQAAVRKGKKLLAQIAYHGSPYKFDEFSLEHIGAGEGAQAHGWGLYFALDEDVAKTYKNELSEKQILRTYKGKSIIGDVNSGFKDLKGNDVEIKQNSPEYFALSSVVSADKQQSIAGLQKKVDGFEKTLARIEKIFGDKASTRKDYLELKNFVDVHKTAIKMVEDGTVQYDGLQEKGTLYQVDIPENESLLNEQLTLSQQPKQVQKAVKSLIEDAKKYHYDTNNEGDYELYDGKKYLGTYWDLGDMQRDIVKLGGKVAFSQLASINENSTGKQIYEALGYDTGTGKDASMLLNEYGVKGIAYDGAQDGKCVVVFDDKAIKILEDVEKVSKDQTSTPAKDKQRVYHVSPNSFTNFDMRYLGSGIGKQKGGYGVYLFENRNNINKATKPDWNAYEVDAPNKENLLISDAHFDKQPPKVQKALKDIQKEIGEKGVLVYDVENEDANAWLDVFAEGGVDREDVKQALIDYSLGKDIAEKVKVIAEQLNPDNDLLMGATDLDEKVDALMEGFDYWQDFVDSEQSNKGLDIDAKGGTIYGQLSKILGGQKQASEFLDEHGIKGSYGFNDMFGMTIVVYNPENAQIVGKPKKVQDFISDNDNTRYSVAKDQTNTPAFKKWFGDSKLKDKDGKPLVLYRGISEAYNVDKQGEVTWVTEDEEQADSYRNGGAGSDVLEVYARVENPLYLGDSWTEQTLTSLVKNKLRPAVDKAFAEKRISRTEGLELHDKLDKMIKNDDKNYIPLFEHYNENPDVLAIIKAAGYDAIQVDENGNTTYGVIGKNNVKSATDNNGDFSADNDDIHYSVAKTEPKRTVSRQELHSAVEKILPLKVEKDYRSDAYKMYNRKANIGFVHAQGSVNELNSIVGMYIDTQKKLSDNADLRNELIANAWDYQQDQKKARKFANTEVAEQVKEGAAYFGRLYATDKDQARALFPKYFAAFEKALNSDKALKAKVDNYLKTADAFFKQTPEGRAKAGLTQLEKEPTTWKEKVKTYAKQAYVDWFDDKDVLRRVEREIETITGKKIKTDESAYMQARVSNSSAASRVDMVVNGAKTKWGKTAAKNSPERKAWYKALNSVYGGAWKYDVCYQDVVDKATSVDEKYLKKGNFKDGMEALGSYLLANRFLEIWETKPNYRASMSKETAAKVVADAPKAIKEAADMYYKFDDNLIAVMNKEGMLSDEGLKGMRNYTRYCPLFRDFADEAAFDKFMSSMSSPNSYINLSNGIKALTEEGSDRTVLDDPTKSMLRMTASILGKVEKNKVGQKFIALSERSNVGQFVIPAIDPKTGKQLDTSNPQFSRFTVWENGEKKAYVTLPEIYDVLENATHASAYAALLDNMIARGASSTLRKGATISMGFMIRNFIRDTIGATINSKNGFIPLKDSFRGMNLLLNDAEFRNQYLASGANMAGYFKQDAESLDNMLNEMAGNGWWQKSSMLDKLHMMWEHYEQIGELIEQGTRAGEFKKALEKNKSLLEAAIDAKEVTLDFSRAGAKGRQFNRIIPFFNAVLQGGDKMVRTAIENPQKTMAMCASLSLATMLLWAINHDDDWYKELDNESKYSNWHFHVGDKHIKIPKPQEFGMLSCASVEAVLEQMFEKNPKAMSDWAAQFVETMTPSLLPALYRPILEVCANYDYHFQSAIVGKKYQNLKPEAQVNSNTSEFARIAGGMAGYSPIKIDHLIRGYFGGAGAFVARIPNKVLADGKQPAKYWNEMPVINEFVENDFAHSKSVNNFYELMDAANKQHTTYGKKGQPSSDVVNIRKYGTIISGLRKDIQKITANRVISPERKRQLIENKTQRINQVARRAVEKYGDKYL